ncbi:hypothetical protein [Halomonas sp. H5]
MEFSSLEDRKEVSFCDIGCWMKNFRENFQKAKPGRLTAPIAETPDQR